MKGKDLNSMLAGAGNDRNSLTNREHRQTKVLSKYMVKNYKDKVV